MIYCANVNYSYDKTRIPKEEDSSGETIQYHYSDANGLLRIIEHKKGNEYLYREQVGYDNMLRLVSETDEMGGTHTYMYDYNGNMYRHTCNRDGIQSVFNYTYDSTIKDKLLSVIEPISNTTIKFEYNSANEFLPIRIRYNNGITKNLIWQGKRLATVNGSNGTSARYIYNAQGLRTSKKINYDTTSYLYDGTKVIQMTKNVGNDQFIIDFAYDVAGNLIGLNTSEGQYFYRRDITGNILGILDSNGNYVVKYRYDAWGNVLGKSVIVNCIASNHNPFLYKGYMYDEETEWYYLQSRFYIPSLCRFLSPDSVDYVTPSKVGGLNLYAYCYNSPVQYYDPTGTDWKQTVKNFFKSIGQEIRDFFVETLYEDVLKGAYYEQFLKPAFSATKDAIKDFFVKDVYEKFLVNTIYKKGLLPAWKATENFFTNTVPDSIKTAINWCRFTENGRLAVAFASCAISAIGLVAGMACIAIPPVSWIGVVGIIAGVLGLIIGLGYLYELLVA